MCSPAQVQEAIIDLYLQVKVRSQDEVSALSNLNQSDRPQRSRNPLARAREATQTIKHHYHRLHTRANPNSDVDEVRGRQGAFPPKPRKAEVHKGRKWRGIGVRLIVPVNRSTSQGVRAITAAV